MNASTATFSELIPCAGCERLLSADYLNDCAVCGKLYCTEFVEGELCTCNCLPRPTAAAAVEAAQSFLVQNNLALLPTQTLIVEDEYGAVYGLIGPSDWLVRIPDYEEGLEFYMPSEFAGKHKQFQQQAVSDGQSGYLTDNFAVALKQFDIEDRIFTVSVFHPQIPN